MNQITIAVDTSKSKEIASYYAHLDNGLNHYSQPFCLEDSNISKQKLCIILLMQAVTWISFNHPKNLNAPTVFYLPIDLPLRKLKHDPNFIFIEKQLRDSRVVVTYNWKQIQFLHELNQQHLPQQHWKSNSKLVQDIYKQISQLFYWLNYFRQEYNSDQNTIQDLKGQVQKYKENLQSKEALEQSTENYAKMKKFMQEQLSVEKKLLKQKQNNNTNYQKQKKTAPLTPLDYHNCLYRFFYTIFHPIKTYRYKKN